MHRRHARGGGAGRGPGAGGGAGVCWVRAGGGAEGRRLWSGSQESVRQASRRQPAAAQLWKACMPRARRL
jgi:hypothetical protein